MVQQLARSNEVCPRKRTRSAAGKAPRVARLRVAGGVVAAGSDGLEADVVAMLSDPMRRFIVHQWRDDASEGGETWEVIDTNQYAQVALAEHQAQAQMIADALEFAGGHTAHDWFERRMREAVSAHA